jgi:hypothetical protein
MTSTKFKERTQTADSEKIFSQELVMAFVDHLPLMLVGPAIVALAAYVIASVQPGVYSSTAILRIDRATARSLQTLATSAPLADKVLSKYTNTGAGPDGHAAFLAKNLLLADTEAGEGPGEHLFRLEVTHRDARSAQSISSDLIDSWIEAERPNDTERVTLEADLERLKITVGSYSKLIEQLQADGTKLSLYNPLAGELATIISTLIVKRDQGLSAITALQKKLRGRSRDVFVFSPDLPQTPIYPGRRAIALLSGVAAIPLLFTLIILGRYFAPGRSPHKVLSGWFRRAR